ncbi:uncharacterized protein LOC126741333 isoform X2 [Anthonomus grandis grandis]|nr:uncharacterized protein LOC126741333 isoform X2 [Anthonomus grandis grandis]
MLGMGCVCNLTRGLLFATMVFTVALSGCSGPSITQDNTVTIFITYFTACGVGALVSGSLCDRYGRKRYLSYSLLSMFFGSFMAAFAYNNIIIILAVVLVGIGLETNSLQMKLILMETLGLKHRGFYILLYDLFWTLGIVVTIVSVILLETPTFFVIDRSVRVTTWRIMFAVSGCLSIVLACVCSLIEESPRYFLYLERPYLAYLLLKQLYGINKSSYAENFPVKEDELKGLISAYDLSYPEPAIHWKMLQKFLERFWKSLKLIFSSKYCLTTWALIVLKAVAIFFGTYPVGNVFAKVSTYQELDPTLHFASRNVNTLDLIYPAYSMLGDRNFNRTTSICQRNIYHKAYYRNFISIYVPEVVIGQGLELLFVDWTGRKQQLASNFLIPSICFMFLRFVDNTSYAIVANSFIITAIAGIRSMLAIVNLESYPTAVRGTSYGVTTFPGYLLAALAINWIDVDVKLLYVILSVTFLLMLVLIGILPEMKREPLTE